MSHRFNLNRFNGNRFNIHPAREILAAFLILAIGPTLGAGIPAVAAETSSEESTPSATPAALPGTDGTQPNPRREHPSKSQLTLLSQRRR